jgi:hypothetical protein
MAKAGLTEIVCILDRSGSMDSIKKEAIGGFSNGFYWSSSGNGIPEIANGIDFSSGEQGARIVGTLQNVRAIQYF